MKTYKTSVIKFLTALLVQLFFIQIISVAIPLNGPYTIDQNTPTGGTNFQSFTDFAASINLNGISGDVTVTVVAGSGPYTGQVIFNNIAGTGPNATITLDGNHEVLTALTTTTNRHILRLTDCQYFTINNLDIVRDPASSGGFYGIHIFSTGNHITIDHCSVDMTGTTSTLYGGIIASGSETSILETGDFHNLTITNNYTTGGGYGASVFGLITNLASNIVIANNTFISYHSNGIYLRETNGAEIYNNFFDKATNNVTTCNAIQMAQAANVNARIHHNVITVSQTANGSMTQRGIYLFNGTGHKVYNNVIRNIQLTSGGYTAIEIRTGGTAPEIYFNTISLDNPVAGNGNLYGIKEELTNTNSVLRNNMISITQITTGIKTGLVLATNSSPALAYNSDYNDLYVPGGNIAQKGSLSTITYYPTLANWQAIGGQDAHSITTDPIFSSYNLPQPTNGLIDNLGISIPWITNDFTGAVRGNPPDIGAYEFSAGPPAAPDSILGPIAVCEFSSGIPYTVQPVTGASSYTWTITGGIITTGQGTGNITIAINTAPVILTVFASNNSGNSDTISLNITLNPLPLVSFTLIQDTVCLNWAPFSLSGGSPANGTYTGSGINNNIFNPSVAGIGTHSITYSYEDNNACIGSAIQNLTVEICTGIDGKGDWIESCNISPNPFYNDCEISLLTNGMNYHVYLFDIMGNVCLELSGQSTSFNLPADHLSAGFYTLLITDPYGKKIIRKLQKL